MNENTLDGIQVGEVKQISSPIQFLSTVQFAELPANPVQTVQNTATTASVLNITRLKFTNTVATTVTNFLSGQDGQNILVLGDGFTTIANNSNIQTTTGANKLLTANRVYSFTFFGTKWYEASP
jgi:hypothetical protein